MLKWLAITLFFGIAMPSDEIWKLKFHIEKKSAEVYVDVLNNIYLRNKGVIEKYDENGKFLTQYSNKLIGDDVLLDVTNPMKVLLYSPDQMKATFLDSRLGELRDPVRFLAKGYEQVPLAATSHSNGYWIYDAINFQLIRFDQNGEMLRKSANLAQLLRLEFSPNYLMEINDRVFLNDPKHGVFLFDIFGNYLKKLPFKDLDRLVIANNRIFYAKGNTIYATELKTLAEEEVTLPYEEGRSFDIGKSVSAIEVEKGVNIFSSKQ